MSLLHATLELHEHEATSEETRSRRLKVFDCGNASKCGRKKKLFFFYMYFHVSVFSIYLWVFYIHFCSIVISITIYLNFIFL